MGVRQQNTPCEQPRVSRVSAGHSVVRREGGHLAAPAFGVLSDPLGTAYLSLAGCGLDEADVAVVAPIQHVHCLGLGRHEDEEVVAE